MTRVKAASLVLLGLAVGAGAVLLAGQPQAQGQPKEKAPVWEYKVVDFGTDNDQATKELNRLSEEGWEYVGPINPSVTRSVTTGEGQVKVVVAERKASTVAFRRPKR